MLFFVPLAAVVAPPVPALHGRARHGEAAADGDLDRTLAADAAFSNHARRRLAALLRLKLLELRLERLERVRRVIEHHAGVESLFE